MTQSDDATREEPAAVEPTVSTAPPPSRPHRWWSAIPTHLGRARTSTVVLGLLFLAIGALYLNVRPDPPGATTTGGDTGVTTPAPTTGGSSTTPSPTMTPAPATTVEPTPTEETTEETTPSTLPSMDETVPEETTGSGPAPTTDTTPAAPAPTTATPTG